MDKRIRRLSISFKKEYQHVFDHLNGISNKSEYISKAVEHYMNGRHSAIQNEEDIKKIVIKILQNQGNLPQSLTQPPSHAEDHISDEDIEIIAQLF